MYDMKQLHLSIYKYFKKHQQSMTSTVKADKLFREVKLKLFQKYLIFKVI